MESKAQKRSDKQLLALLNDGDRSALGEIYQLYASQLFGYAIKRLNCNETAADLIQELFLKLWIKRASVSVKGELQAYLTFCLRNIIIDHYSHQQVKDKYLSAVASNEADHQTVNLLDYNDTRRVLQTGVNALPPKMQQVFHLSKVEDYSIDEIAEELKLSRQTVKNQLGNAIRRLQMSMSSFLAITLIFLSLQK